MLTSILLSCMLSMSETKPIFIHHLFLCQCVHSVGYALVQGNPGLPNGCNLAYVRPKVIRLCQHLRFGQFRCRHAQDTIHYAGNLTYGCSLTGAYIVGPPGALESNRAQRAEATSLTCIKSFRACGVLICKSPPDRAVRTM